MAPEVAILMSTYNGENYVEAQISSLLNQTYKNIKIHIRDDQSSDATPNLLTRIASKEPRIRIVQDTLGNLGPSSSFFELIRSSDSDFFMLCDQDDVWLEDKVETSVRATNTLHPKSKPYLSFTDLTVVDEHLSTINASFNKRQRLNIKHSVSFKKNLAQNIVTGCTVFGNKSLAELAIESYDKTDRSSIIMHDWWLALIASSLGETKYISQSSILYRQHSSNCVGSTGSGVSKALQLLTSGTFVNKTYSYIDAIARQSEAFANAFSKSQPTENIIAAKKLAALKSSPSMSKYISCMRAGVQMSSFDRDLGILFSLLFREPKNKLFFRRDAE